MSDAELTFSKKYTAVHAQTYFKKHHESVSRRLSHWREVQMARRALTVAGRPQSVLDIPCGTGRFWELLAEEPHRKIYAADLNANMFETGLKLRAPELIRRIEVFTASAFSIPKPDEFVECVFSIRLLHHIEKPEHRMSILREFKRVSSSTIIVSLWIDGNFRARRHVRKPRKLGHDRFVVPRSVLEEEFAKCGLRVLQRVDFLKFYSMWAAYVLQK